VSNPPAPRLGAPVRRRIVAQALDRPRRLKPGPIRPFRSGVLALLSPWPLPRPDREVEVARPAAPFADDKGGFSHARFYVEVDRSVSTALRRMELERQGCAR
jgi:hypothetical protein